MKNNENTEAKFKNSDATTPDQTKIDATADALQKNVPGLERATALQLAQRDVRNLAAQPQWIRDCVWDYALYPRQLSIDAGAAIVRDIRTEKAAQRARDLCDIAHALIDDAVRTAQLRCDAIDLPETARTTLAVIFDDLNDELHKALDQFAADLK